MCILKCKHKVFVFLFFPCTARGMGIQAYAQAWHKFMFQSLISDSISVSSYGFGRTDRLRFSVFIHRQSRIFLAPCDARDLELKSQTCVIIHLHFLASAKQFLRNKTPLFYNGKYYAFSNKQRITLFVLKLLPVPDFHGGK